MPREKMDLEWLVLLCLFYTIFENPEIAPTFAFSFKNRFTGAIQK